MTIVCLVIATGLLAGGCGDRDIAGMPAEPVRPVSFAVFGNTGLAEDDGAAFFRLTDAMNASGADFAVDVGNRLPDGVCGSDVDAAWTVVRERADSLDVPLYPVAGGSDSFDAVSDAAYNARFGPRWYTFRRNGVTFAALDTGDGAYKRGFGLGGRIGGEQAAWLGDLMGRIDPDAPLVVFMHRPLWVTDPGLWRDTLLPLLRQGGADLVVTAYDDGLADWGEVDGIRAISTGCTDLSDVPGAGRFPHAVIVTVTDGGVECETLVPDGRHTTGISIDTAFRREMATLRDAFTMPVLDADASWDIGETVRLRMRNPFADTLRCTLDFTIFSGTSWRIDPLSVEEVLAPGDERTVNIRVDADAPELGPTPEYTASVTLGGQPVIGIGESLRVRIPRQRTGEPVRVTVAAADIVPYEFDGGSLRIPVEVKYPDTCGRLIICSDGLIGSGQCLYISPLADFRPGMNEFTWNGRDAAGNPVPRGNLTYHVAAYNKEAPPTWVADGPPDRYGAFTVERTASGLRAHTHTDSTLVYYRMGAPGDPEPVTTLRLEHILDGAALKSAVTGEDDRLYLLTAEGIAGLTVRNGEAAPLVMFGHGGYRTFAEYHGREFGGIAYANELVYMGIGGGDGRPPLVAAFHGQTGELVAEYPLGEYYGERPEPPAVNAEVSGIYCSHPVFDTVLHIAPDGGVQWVNEAGNWVVGADSDGMSFSYHPGRDRVGFVYTNTFGYSARCGVLGPDGSALFRVILTQLPGLRTGDIVPMIEGRETDGLYFVTRGGDRPYVFHVPYTIDSGVIVDQSAVVAPDEQDAPGILR